MSAHRTFRAAALFANILVLTAGAPHAADDPTPAKRAQSPDPRARKAVAVEMFVSQGCDLCPTAELLLGKLDAEFGADRIVPVSFHVDYFNDPWKDPFSDPQFSQREWQYSTLYTRARGIKDDSYLYLTPLLMVDGRAPMVGSNRDTPSRARAAIREALNRPAAIAIDANLSASAATGDRALSIHLSALDRAWAEREVLVEVVTVEDGLTTKVASGELEGRTYNGRFTARAFAFRPVVLPKDGDAKIDLRFSLPPGSRTEKTSLAILVQDEATGAILQARRLPWTNEPKPAAEPDGNNSARPAARN